MTPRLSEINTIVFDLGAVIVDINPQAVVDEFSRLTRADGSKLRDLIVHSDYLYQYETGQLTDTQFVEAFNGLFHTTVSEQDFRHAWNLMITGIPTKRLQLLESLKSNFQVLLLSNTNPMHENRFDEVVMESTGKLMKDHAHQAYYSHHVGLRKPEAEIFHYIMEKSAFEAQKALFFDDNEGNILAAQQVGLNAVHVKHPDMIFEILANE